MALYAFNGTWNSEKTDDVSTPENETGSNTNVITFRNAYRDAVGYYCNGVGTRVSFLGKALGGAFGVGGFTRLDEAMTALRSRFDQGDRTIDIVGFSRGAALALAFANRVAKDVKDARGRPARIRFLGVFDVVGSFGIPFNIWPFKFQEYNLGYELTLPPNVEFCFHALALDERRGTFRPTRVHGACEVWFRGSHSDVGGGNQNQGLNAIPLCWLLHKARACGVPVDETHLLTTAGARKPDAAVRFASFDPVKDTFRSVLSDDMVHYTVTIPCGNGEYQDPPAGCKTETVEMEQQVSRSALFSV
jgi:uncharacterized protein (DUF2235 family)